MLFQSTLLLAALPYVFSISVATNASIITNTSTSTNIQCATAFGEKSIAHVPSATGTRTVQDKFSVVVTSTNTPITTITAVANTTTLIYPITTTLTITDPTVTNVFNTTSTVFTTESSTISVTSTAVITVQTSGTTTATSTIDAPAGFSGAPDTQAAPTVRKRYESREVKETPSPESAEEEDDDTCEWEPEPEESSTVFVRPSAPRTSTTSLISQNSKNSMTLSTKLSTSSKTSSTVSTTHSPNKLCNSKPHQYPESVDCVDTVYVKLHLTYIFAASTSTITISPATITVNTTTVYTSTSTVIPANVSITNTFISTSTLTSLTTLSITATSTTTRTILTTTTISVYAACQTSNQLSAAKYGSIDHYDVSSGSFGLTQVTATSAYDCCVQCMKTGLCVGTFYEAAGGLSSPGVGSCFIAGASGTSCASGQLSNSIGYVSQASPNYGPFVISNGNCGTMYSYGSG